MGDFQDATSSHDNLVAQIRALPKAVSTLQLHLGVFATSSLILKHNVQLPLSKTYNYSSTSWLTLLLLRRQVFLLLGTLTSSQTSQATLFHPLTLYSRLVFNLVLGIPLKNKRFCFWVEGFTSICVSGFLWCLICLTVLAPSLAVLMRKILLSRFSILKGLLYLCLWRFQMPKFDAFKCTSFTQLTVLFDWRSELTLNLKGSPSGLRTWQSCMLKARAS